MNIRSSTTQPHYHLQQTVTSTVRQRQLEAKHTFTCNNNCRCCSDEPGHAATAAAAAATSQDMLPPPPLLLLRWLLLLCSDQLKFCAWQSTSGWAVSSSSTDLNASFR
jgi:hypothetical protein